jgi:hypothetical protein
MKKDDLVIPTDAAALLFGVLIFSVAIFVLNRRSWSIRTHIGTSQQGTGYWPNMRFLDMIFFLILQPVSLG